MTKCIYSMKKKKAVKGTGSMCVRLGEGEFCWLFTMLVS